ncbi:type VI secretion system Vgr family protein [Pseudomonas sp. LP_7_YM]|uniref:type VI secretion system Vgr family protein n=1 Tax=Pseudomonas sp. LP_7_YM TaxID=2485137 RepID=UPI0014150226|nr:contractile injection system protein, VgrG/Pvc8 family [Pseudomonas sp. LP_7_YM]
MRDSQVTMTLAIANNPSDWLVIGVNGRDRLNAPFCYDIDLVSPAPNLDCTSLLLRDAWLQMGGETARMHGLHGQIHQARRLYQGPGLSLYRLRLMPALQRLAGPVRRRAFNGQSVPQIITLLLHAHGLDHDAMRFDHLLGVYPPRKHCLQYDESDLHFLSRLCEEEGISFRFEHHLHRHIVVFSDDPMGFAQWLEPVSVDHLAEQLSVRTSYSSHASEQYVRPPCTPDPDGYQADQQPRRAPLLAAAACGQQQLSARQLERLRCERREIMGRSRLPWLRGGLVVQVGGHPDTFFNDHWLLTDVCHCAWHLAPLRGCVSREVIRILQVMASADTSGEGGASLLHPRSGLGRPSLAGYEKSFRVLPWAMPYRPALEHPKPVVVVSDVAIQVDEQTDASGRVRIRYDWQPASLAGSADDSWAAVTSGLARQAAGTTLQIGFFEGDPDQPLVCAVLPPGPDHSRSSGASGNGKQLCIDSIRPVTLTSARATLRVTEQGVHFTAHETEK